MKKSLFPRERLSGADYILGLALVAGCFAFFFHADMWGVGWDSLNYLFGSPLEFYENCKKIRGGGLTMVGTPYPPSVYMVFALWLYPLKLLGLLTDPQTFPLYLTYWLKTLTTAAYVFSGAIFYRIALEYVSDRRWAKYATVAWLTTPFALFSQFIFSQYDIFYVVLVLVGFLQFLRGGLFRASLCFGLAITFKYFPAFAYLPLLMLYEKRIWRLALCALIFIAPLTLIELPYGDSPAFIEGVKNHSAINRIFAVAVDLGSELKGFRIYFLVASFAILCGLTYFIEADVKARARTAAYVWLVGSILPFLFIFWHPQWVISFAPAIVLTSMISSKRKEFMLLDLAGMAFFIATVSLVFQRNADADLFKARWLGFDFGNSFLMANLFDWFGGRSVGVFWSGFWAYLALQLVLKHGLSQPVALARQLPAIDYGEIRQRVYVGLLIFLLPAALVMYVDWKRNESYTVNFAFGKDFGELLSGRAYEQTFVAEGRAIERVSVLLETFGRDNSGDVTLKIVGTDGRTLVESRKSVATFQNAGWQDFAIEGAPVLNKSVYKIRLTAPLANAGNAISWIASPYDTYPQGVAIVDGIAQNADFSFRVGFAR